MDMTQKAFARCARARKVKALKFTIGKVNKMFEKLRRDWEKDKVNVLFQCVSGIACGLLSALYLTTENRVFLICLILIAGITLLSLNKDRVK